MGTSERRGDVLLRPDEQGLACALGGFWIDPWKPVECAVVTHAHSDHARAGSGMYYCASEGLRAMRRRLGSGARIQPVEYGERFRLGNVTVSLHPAGHIRGSAQVRVESADHVSVCSGDYKRQHDATCTPFEVLPCDTFITESTFGLPIYRWEAPKKVSHEILTWWNGCAERGQTAVLLTYSLGKAQRLLAELWQARDAAAEQVRDRTIRLHGAAMGLTEDYRADGVTMWPTEGVSEASSRRREYAGELVIAPPSAAGSPWMRRFGPDHAVETGFASGWMAVRGVRRGRGYDRGFVLSDHADWPELIGTIGATGASKVLVTHGQSVNLSRWLQGEGVDAEPLETQFEGEAE
jgi:putative mRNA 3-end processing factor